ncbi:MAG: translation initiation factor IF-2, partial [Actinomycetota bacterium]
GPGAPRPAGAPPRPGMRPPGPGSAPPPPPGPARGRDDRRARPARGAPARPGGEDDAGSRFGRGELHLSDAGMARRGARKKPGQRRQEASRSGGGTHGFSRPLAPMTREVAIGDSVVVADLAQKLALKCAEVVKALFKMGVMATINQTIDHDTAVLVVEELGHTAVRANENDVEDALIAHAEQAGEGEPRPPVVTIMGHVDHGKTSLLDHIRRTRVASGEAGGITQHIGAYQVVKNEKKITFIDTPGHAAFTKMRARGAGVTDIVVLVVAADDGVMPQTIEAINHARAADVPIVVALNKIDKPNADVQRVLAGLAEQQLTPESWGGDTIVVEMSAQSGLGIDDLLEQLNVVAEIGELHANPTGRAKGVVLEAQLDVGRGPVATILVDKGTLKVGDPMVAGSAWGKVRAMLNDRGEQIKEAGPSTPIQVLGLSSVPSAGDEFRSAPDERTARTVAGARELRFKAMNQRGDARVQRGVKLEDIFSQIQAGEVATFNVIVKSDVHGSLEAVTESLRKLERDDVRAAFVHRGVGTITENDISLAAATNATLIGFNVRPDRKIRELAEKENVEIRTYEIIYKLLEDIEKAMKGLLAPEFVEVVTGEAEVREIFRAPKVGAVAGCAVVSGVVTRGSRVRFLRDGAVIWKGNINTLRRFKDDVKEVREGFECGISLTDFQDLKPGDVIETYDLKEVERV